MEAFVVHAIDPSIVTQVRQTLVAPGYGHPVHRELARGTGPCRACLRTFTVGTEERLLFTFDPFAGSAHLSQPDPVFIHADECELRTDAGFPSGLRGMPIAAECHHEDGAISAPQPLTGGSEDHDIRALLTRANVRFLHLRHGEAGCFIARVDRGE